jgi:hypothetical protein
MRDAWRLAIRLYSRIEQVLGFQQKVYGVRLGERTGKRPFVIINSIELIIFSRRRPL